MAAECQTIEYRDGDTQLAGVLFTDPARSKKRPGLLLVHAGSGLDDHAKCRAQTYAELGFVVFACDMFGPGIAGNRERILATLGEMRTNPGKLCQRARAGLDMLTARPQFDGRIAAIGYCFGGMTVLQMARSGMSLVAAVSVHGSLATVQPATAGSINAKILVCHGARDPHIPMPHVAAFVDEMKAAGADWQLIIYGGALHGFTHQAPSLYPGVAYNAAADARSTIAIQDFFAEIFGTPDSMGV